MAPGSEVALLPAIAPPAMADGCQTLPAWGMPLRLERAMRPSRGCAHASHATPRSTRVSTGFGVGVFMGVIGSIGINVGQNIQAQAIHQLAAGMKGDALPKPWKSRLWWIGQLVFIAFALINFSALALAPASILTPLESLQFVTNVFYNRIVNKAHITLKMAGAVALASVGIVLIVVFGASSGGCRGIPQLVAFWTRWLWWLYLMLTAGIAATAFMTHRIYWRRRKAGRPLPGTPLVLPITYSLYAALAGGAQVRARWRRVLANGGPMFRLC